MYYCGKKEWDKIINYAKAAYSSMKTEIGGMAVMIKDENDDWHLKDPVILKQVVTSGNTHLDKECLAAYYGKTAMKMMKKKNVVYKYLWWHSHHTMQAFWSGTDQDTINEAEEMSDLSFSLVVNLAEEYKFRIALWKPIKVQQDLELQIESTEKKVPSSIEKEVEDLCIQEKPVYSLSNYNRKSGYSTQTNMWNSKATKTVAAEDIIEVSLKRVKELLQGACDGTIKYEFFDKELDKLADTLAAAGEQVVIQRITKEQFNDGHLLGITEHDILMDEETWGYNMGYAHLWR